MGMYTHPENDFGWAMGIAHPEFSLFGNCLGEKCPPRIL